MGTKKKVVKKIVKKEEPQVNEIVNQIVKLLKPELDHKIESLRSDLNADFEERIAKIKIPAPSVATPGNVTPGNGFNMDGIMKALQGKDGGIDMNAISSMMQNQQASPMTNKDGSLIDIKELSAGQIEFMKMQRQDKMIMTFMPLLMGQMNQQGNPMINEMMNRLFMEKISSSLYMDRAMMQGMVKMFSGGKMPEGFAGMQQNLSTPINDAISKTAITPQPGSNVTK